MPTFIASCSRFFQPEHYTPNSLFVSHLFGGGFIKDAPFLFLQV